MQKVFISHTPEDNDFADELAHELEERHISVLHENDTILNWGDSLTKIIEEGIKKPAYGILVLSHAFLSKLWSRRELDNLAALCNKNLLMMIWRNINQEEVAKYSQALANADGLSAEHGASTIAAQIAGAITTTAEGPAAPAFMEKALPRTLSIASQPADLQKLLMHNFSESEIRDIYHHLGVKFHEEEYSKRDHVNYLLMKLQRRGDLEKLIGMLKQLRPSIDWETAPVQKKM